LTDYKQIRLQFIRTLGGKCVDCGCTDLSRLEINHTKRIIGYGGDLKPRQLH